MRLSLYKVKPQTRPIFGHITGNMIKREFAKTAKPIGIHGHFSLSMTEKLTFLDRIVVE